MIRFQVTQRLLPCVLSLDKLAVLDTLDNLNMAKKTLTKTKDAVAQAIWFNSSHCDGRYRLDLANYSDRALLDRIMLIDAWHSMLRQSEGKIDLSEFGNWRNLRACRYNKIPIQYDEHWPVPKQGRLDFVYLAPHKPKAGFEPMSEERFDAMLNTFHAIVDDGVRLIALHTILHCIWLSTDQAMQILGEFPETNDRDLIHWYNIFLYSTS